MAIDDFVLAIGIRSFKTVASMAIVLASGSARRCELLQQVGVDFDVKVFEIDESCIPDETPHYVTSLAEAKARAAQLHLPTDCVVIAADTTVTIGGRILGKPVDQDDAFAMWQHLSGQTHQVLTGVTVACGDRLLSSVVATSVHMLALTSTQMQAYWDTGEPLGKSWRLCDLADALRRLFLD